MALLGRREHCSHQFNYLDQHPVVGRVGHEFEERGCQRKVVLWILAGQLTDDVHGSRLHAYAQQRTHSQRNKSCYRYAFN